MTDRSTHHATFTIERRYPVSPTRVFAAWADPVAKARWFAGPPGWTKGHHDIDFCVGGREHLRIEGTDGVVHEFDGSYQDIVADERIVFTYAMTLDDVRISVSLTTVELTADGEGTRLTFTEQGVFLDGTGTVAAREVGTEALLDNLGTEFT